jgi:hypothetical protein
MLARHDPATWGSIARDAAARGALVRAAQHKELAQVVTQGLRRSKQLAELINPRSAMFEGAIWQVGAAMAVAAGVVGCEGRCTASAALGDKLAALRCRFQQPWLQVFTCRCRTQPRAPGAHF